MPNATVTFNHKLVSCDFKNKVASFEQVIWKEQSAGTEDMELHQPAPAGISKTKAVHFDFVIRCDGAYSVVRQCMMRQLDMDFGQSYIDAVWCDFVIPPIPDGQYHLDPQYLHVWPAKDSIVIAQTDFVSTNHFNDNAAFNVDQSLGRLFSCGYSRSYRCVP